MVVWGEKMIFNKLIVKNFKQFRELDLEINPDINIIVGDNESGKSTILEAIALATTGHFNGRNFDGFLSNEIFNYAVSEEYRVSLSTDKKLPPPTIEIELYAIDNPNYAMFKGTNNSQGQNVPGISYIIEFNNEFGDSYKTAFLKGEIKDLPLEFYHFTWKSFSGMTINAFNNPIAASIIDTAQVNNNIIGSYIGREIKESLSDDEIRNLGTAYRSARNNFSQEATLKILNEQIIEKAKFPTRNISIALTSVTTAEWQKELSLCVDHIAFSFAGRGIQNAIKTNLALRKETKDKAIILLIEEPENNLSYTNMTKLIAEIIENNVDKQIFIATHSSFVANKLGLDKIIMLSKTAQRRLGALPKETIDYFKKLPGYETLRLVIASNVILVEGPTDELILQAAYFKKYDKVPISDGIDIIAIQSLAFKRFCDIANLLKKHVVVITDNDGDIVNKIEKKYKDYTEFISIVYEKDEKLNTIEPSFVNANQAKIKELSNYLLGAETTEDSLLSYMSNHKTEWALKVFDASKDFEYPEYIYDAIACIEK